MRWGIFGGTFDPIHFGHLLLAECCREQCRLDQVWFVPAGTPPHKRNRRVSTPAQRLEMVRLAVAGHAEFHVSDDEIQRGGVSYTVDTLDRILAQYPQAELFLLMGADSLDELPTWRNAARICELAIPVVIRRRGSPEPDFQRLASLVAPPRLETIRGHQVQMPLVEFSSTAIREAVAAGRSIRFQTPRAVEVYLQSQQLYR